MEVRLEFYLMSWLTGLSCIESNVKLCSHWKESPLIEKTAIALHPSCCRLVSCCFGVEAPF